MTIFMQTDVLIVGGAAVGSAAAFFLASQPDFKGNIHVIEQDFSYEKSATALSAASIRHQFSNPENIKLSQFGSAFLKNIAQYLAIGDEVPALTKSRLGSSAINDADGTTV